MIQRIQTLWLILAIAAAILSIQLSFYSGLLLSDNSYQRLTGTSDTIILVCTTFNISASLFAIFLFKTRKQQLTVTLISIVLSVLVIILYFLQLKNFKQGSFDLTSLFAFSVPVFLILAALGIRKDAKLIKSLDRLR